MSKLLFIMGAPKTCTSSILGMLNCNPDIFIMYEAFMSKKIKSGDKILSKHRIHAGVINKKHSMTKIYKGLDNVVGKNYKYFGDKWARLDDTRVLAKWIEELKPHNVIFTVRDLKTWLVHNVVVSKQKLHRGGEHLANNIIRYVYYYISSFKLPHCERIRLEDFVGDNDAIINRLDNFLPNVSLRPHVEDWWEKIGDYNDPKKHIHPWWIPGPGRRRDSSFVKPSKLDISVTMKDHVMWQKVLPIFNKYYDSPTGSFSEEEIEQDLNSLLRLKLNLGSVDDFFEQINAVKLGAD